MRLLRAEIMGGFSLTKFDRDKIPCYAILSHTWLSDEREVTFEDIHNHTGSNKEGYAKLTFCAERARRDGLEFFWVDTCCIKQSNSSELAEAINCMFRWYQGAEKCYVFLADVSLLNCGLARAERDWQSSLRDSKWFRRGWTLQELLAPQCVEFWSCDGALLGDKKSLEQQISEITRIPVAALRMQPLHTFSVDERKSWMLGRQTQLEEDQAYCLMGIFDVSMLPNYGEPKDKAMSRLDDEIAQAFRKRLNGFGRATPMSNEADLMVLPGGALVKKRRKVLESLRLNTFDARRKEIKHVRPGSCSWLLKVSTYQRWEDPIKYGQQYGFLLLDGNAGTGKSTVMKFAHEHAKSRKLADDVVISYFFNARGEESEKSTLGMWKALLYQVLGECPDLQDTIDIGVFPSPYDPSAPPWTLDILCATFAATVVRLGNRRLQCFVDALDECEEYQIREMLSTFHEVSIDAADSGVQMKVCFASRPYPTVSVRNAQTITLQAQEGHNDALAKFVSSRLYEGHSSITERVRSDILEKANGVFMWVVLVIPMLNAAFERGRIYAVESLLSTIPTELSDVFKQILRRDTANMDETQLCLQWVCFAAHPLTKEELFFGVVSGLGRTHVEALERDLEQVTEDSMRRFVSSSSKGLAELPKSSNTVQFIHESVRDFLVKDRGLIELWPELGDDLTGISHQRLKQCCQTYHDIDRTSFLPLADTVAAASQRERKQMQEELRTRFPLLSYANQYILEHADQSVSDVAGSVFLKSFRFDSWIKIRNHLAEIPSRHHIGNTSLLYALAEGNYTHLIRALCPDGPLVGESVGHWEHSLCTALQKHHQDAVQALLQPEWLRRGMENNFNALIKSKEKGALLATSSNQYLHPLLWAIREGFDDVVAILLDAPDLEPDAVTHLGRDALSFAAESGCEAVVYWYIRTGRIETALNKKATSYYGEWTPIQFAIALGRESMVDLLLGNGANLSGNATLLHLAAGRGRCGVVYILLDRGIDIETRDSQGDTALFYAVRSRFKKALQALLDRGADVDARNTDGDTVLILAAFEGDLKYVRFLLDKGANTEVTNNDGKTALLSAAGSGHKDCVRLLLEKGSSIGLPTVRGLSAHLAATEQNREQCVQALLTWGRESSRYGQPMPGHQYDTCDRNSQ
ncbi:uncharacterized protein HMPREF1541_08543 [Cyphellophora europaea CBS 101466]|uniref:Uncharacterized protein n=1 Tax=Cyphellophora europaea (strain CBS 101466) TaxID=1220924 RepID=W2RIG1_CYPE1|nr:uncharacterized protein HMPREF1541_08543 [Cyphellophora europaea CBS 101466]ETN36266.1 hypothetical protein HMPREF1541_08543 [Cyphellophora europaea CBS 101466]